MINWSKYNVLLAFCVCLSCGYAVPPPTNVSVSCHNFQNMLYWNYTEPGLHPNFSVVIHAYNSEKSDVFTTETYLDISDYTADATDAYLISVQALLDESVSSSSESTQFSYNQDFTSSTKCAVDFPSLNISALPHKVVVFFEHPYNIYGIDSLNDTFSYRVSSAGTEIEDDCFTEELCRMELHLPESIYGRCITINLSGYANEIPTETIKEVCCCNEIPKDHDFISIVTIVGSIGVALLIFILIGVLSYRKLTRSDSQNPIIAKLLSFVSADVPVVEPERPPMSDVQSVSHTPLLDSPEEVFSTVSSLSPEEVTHLPIHITTEADSSEEHGDMEEDEGCGFNTSGYDCGKFIMEISPGDEVEAYGPR